jgi:MFS family permease
MEGGTSSKRLLPWLVAVAFFMESLDTTILNTAVPAIAQALRVAPLSMKAGGCNINRQTLIWLWAATGTRQRDRRRARVLDTW